MAQLGIDLADDVKKRLVELAGPRNVGRYITKMLAEHDQHTAQIGSLKSMLESISRGQDRLEGLLHKHLDQKEQY